MGDVEGDDRKYFRENYSSCLEWKKWSKKKMK